MKKYLFDHEEHDEVRDRNVIYLKEENITLEEGITSIEDCCFKSCVNLKTINIPNSVTSIGNDCFSNCSKFNTKYQLFLLK